MGFIYTLIGIPLVVFGGTQFKIMGVIYIFMPIIMGVIGFLCIVIFGAIYNALAKRLGGVEVEVTSIEYNA